MKAPFPNDWEAATRGALVPSVAYWKATHGQPLTELEQAFIWGYTHGHDEVLERWKQEKKDAIKTWDNTFGPNPNRRW